jgi:hypothetical protein
LSIYFCLIKIVESTKNESTGGDGRFQGEDLLDVGRDLACNGIAQKAQSFSRAEFSARQERQGSPLFSKRGRRKAERFHRACFWFSELLFFHHNKIHSNYFQFYNDAILGIGESPFSQQFISFTAEVLSQTGPQNAGE